MSNLAPDVAEPAVGPDWGDGDLGRIALEHVCRGRPDVLAAARRVRADAEGPDPTALERCVGELVAIGWAQAHSFELERAALAPGPARDAVGKLLRGAQRRYLSAVRTLAYVRRRRPSAPDQTRPSPRRSS